MWFFIFPRIQAIVPSFVWCLPQLCDFSPSSHLISFLLSFPTLSPFLLLSYKQCLVSWQQGRSPLLSLCLHFTGHASMPTVFSPNVSSIEKYMRKQLVWKGTSLTHTHTQKISSEYSHTDKLFFCCQHPTLVVFISCLQISLLALKFRLLLNNTKPQLQLSILMTIINYLSL